jgi:sugar lactone lactonase YvrE
MGAPLRVPDSSALYRVEPDWSFAQIVSGVTQSNGIAWSPGGSRMYFIDSATQDIDVSTSTLAPGRPATGDGWSRSSVRMGYPMG